MLSMGRWAMLMGNASTLEVGFHKAARELLCGSTLTLGGLHAGNRQKSDWASDPPISTQLGEPLGNSSNQQKRWMCASSVEVSTKPDVSLHKNSHFEYKGPFSAALRRVKILSITSCGLAFASCPAILLLPNTMGNVSGKLGLTGALCVFGLFSTGMLHWFSSPYVHDLKFDKKTREIEVKTLNFFARERQHKFPLDAVKYADTWRPLATFEVNGRYFYIDKDNFADKRLLAKLSAD